MTGPRGNQRKKLHYSVPRHQDPVANHAVLISASWPTDIIVNRQQKSNLCNFPNECWEAVIFVHVKQNHQGILFYVT